MESLSVRYRPHKFEDVTSQSSVIKILERQISLREFGNTYLFCGPSGTGKTTIARIFANEVNNGSGDPIEIDAASNNGVDNVKSIIQSASERSLTSEYKVIIMDEAHMLTTQSWNALLKCIEEPPRYTIFIFCTTDPQKIPATIINRVMRFNLTKISADNIKNRLLYISKSENFTNYEDACSYISRICGGGMRDAISLLEKCANYDTNLSMENVLSALGDYSYFTYFKLIEHVVYGEVTEVVKVIEDIFAQGNDMKLFLDKFLEFCLDLTKYILMQDINVTKIPSTLENDLKRITSFDNSLTFFYGILDKLMRIKNSIKNDSDIKSTIEVGFIDMTRE